MKMNDLKRVDLRIMNGVLLNFPQKNSDFIRGWIWGNGSELSLYVSYKLLEYLEDNEDFMKCYREFRSKLPDDIYDENGNPLVYEDEFESFNKKAYQTMNIEQTEEFVLNEMRNADSNMGEAFELYENIFGTEDETDMDENSDEENTQIEILGID